METTKHAFLSNAKYGIRAGDSDPSGELFGFGDFSSIPHRRSVCEGDSGGPVMDFHLSNNTYATLVGVLHATLPPCRNNNFSWTRRKYDSTYVGPGLDDNVVIVKMSRAVKVARHLQWMQGVMGFDGYQKCHDALANDTGILGKGPDWDKSKLPTTDAPPIDFPLDNMLFN